MGFIATLIVAYMIREDSPLAGIVFAVVAAALLALRLAVTMAFARMGVSNLQLWLRLNTLGFGASGLLWGALLLWAVQWGAQTDGLILSCIALGALTMAIMNISYPPAFHAFACALLITASMGMMISPYESHRLLGLAGALLCVMLTFAAHGLGEKVVSSFRLSVENELLAEQLAAANAELHELVRTDALTGLASRRAYMERLAENWAHAVMDGRTLALLAIDIDHFKRVNDTLGHAGGDLCLRYLGMLLADTGRTERDMVARQGGEEFSLCLVDTDREKAMATAEGIRRKVGEASGAAGSAFPCAITLSIGVCTMAPKAGDQVEAFVQGADSALYRAKANGRNCVVLHEAPAHCAMA
jgi:diguanylate cyclase (GGDEF)-like protein